MLIALPLTPLILAIPTAATAPALVIVGIAMLQSISEIDMSDFKTAAPAVLTLLGIPLTFSVAEGIGFGLISAALLAIAGVSAFFWNNSSPQKAAAQAPRGGGRAAG